MANTDLNKLKLRPKKSFTPFPRLNGEEFYPNGIFEFNITQLLRAISENPLNHPVAEIEVNKYHRSQQTINEAHLDSVDVNRPIILAEISPGQFNVIDGNHRLEKAHRLGLVTIPAHKFSVYQHLAFLTSTKAYVAFIEYWNGKVRNLVRNQKYERFFKS